MAANTQCGSLSYIASPKITLRKAEQRAKIKAGLSLAEPDQKSGSHSENAAAAIETWRVNIYRKVGREMGLAAAESEDEMRLLRTLIDALRTFRRRLSATRFD